ncbi:MAG: polyprenyl synthetase family protein [Bdellovibrionota bacterium]|nr:polyprenyl synthetase family protein [Bdellovibrionota bacterium]
MYTEQHKKTPEVDSVHNEISQNLKEHLRQCIPNQLMKDVYEYCVLPPGKLFRPKLVYAIAKDLSKEANLQVTQNHQYLASFVEVHHAYTLVHDDLPCMDDDDFRRNKPSAHKAYGEWKALLAGDGLLNISYELLSKVYSPHLNLILKIITRCLGPKGLIQGQVLDLSHETLKSFDSIKEVHELKTARLIQVALLTSYLVIESPKDNLSFKYRISLELLKLGKAMGLAFQFIDDLSELTSENLTKHELEINPWLNHSRKVLGELSSNLIKIENIIEKRKLYQFDVTFKEYIFKMNKAITSNIGNILKNFEAHQKDKLQEKDLVPIMRLLQRIGQ